MKLISLNIEHNKHDNLVLPFLKKEQADVICIQELLEDKFEFYKNELSMDGVFGLAGYVDFLVYKNLAGKKQGVAIFSKKIIKSASMLCAGQEVNASMPFSDYQKMVNSLIENGSSYDNFRENKSLAWVDVEDSQGSVLKFATTQLPVTTKGEVTPYQLQVINDLMHTLESFGELVLCGDMNAPRGRDSFAQFLRKYKDNIPLKYETSIDQNLHRVKGIQVMVDGLFTTPSYIASDVKLVDGVSDHMAIVANIYRK